MKMVSRVWAFECPLHGLETNVFCFRAHDPDLVHNWRLFNVTWIEEETELPEKKKYQRTFHEYYS